MRDHKDLMESFRVLYQMQKDYIMNCPAASRGVSELKQLELLVMKLVIFRFLTLTLNIFLNHRLITLFTDGIDVIPISPEFTAP